MIEGRNKGREVHFASLADLCHLKNSELEPQYQKYKGRVVLRGDIVKDDSGSYAVFDEQGSSASQMTAPKVMDIMSRFPGCSGPAADAVSAYTQVKNGFGFVYLSTDGQNQGPVWKTHSFLSKGICVVTLWKDYCGKGNWRLLLEHGWEKVLKLECSFVNRARGLSLSVYVDNIKLAGKTENIEPSWNCFHEDVDLEEPTSFLDHVYLG